MKKNKIAASIIEAMVVLAILSIGIVGVYGFFSKSKAFLDGVSAKVEAIEIAREGIEALENIRNTNWLRFGSNIDNCWDTLNYDSNCILANGTKIGGTEGIGKTYILQNEQGAFKLEEKSDTGSFKDLNYRQNFSVGKDKNTGKYCQPVNDSTCLKRSTDGKTIIGNYTRKIKVENIGFDVSVPSKLTKIKVTVTVEWTDQSSSGVRKIVLENLLTNYKN